MLDDTTVIKFLLSFFILIGSLAFLYYYLNKTGKALPLKTKGEIKIKDIKYISKDKGFILVEVKNNEFFFYFDSSRIKVVKSWENQLNEKKDSS